MTRLLNLVFVAVICMISATALAQTESAYANLSIGDMISDGEAKVEEMTEAVAHVRQLRADAEEADDVSAYQRLNNFYTSMNSRLLYAEEALESLRATRRGSSKARTKQGGSDRALAEHHYGVIVAAHTRVMSDYRQALSVMNEGTTEGDGTTVTGTPNSLPGYDVTDRGRTLSPAVDRYERDNSEFQGRTPATATGGGT